MSKQQKLTIATLSVLISVLASALITFYFQSANKTFGSMGSRNLRLAASAVATSTVTYFRAGAASATYSPTATTTLLTVGCNSDVNGLAGPTIEDIDTMALNLQQNATGTSNGTIFVQPQISMDCKDWYSVSSIVAQGTTAGSAVNVITLPSASSTVIAFVPGQTGTTSQQAILKDIIGKAIRFRVWAVNASTTVWMQTAAVERITR